jgi:GT2 family glycosyltransferase
MTQHDAPRCAVVVATRGRGAKIAPLLETLLASELTDFEAVVVDQSLDDTTEAAVAPFLADARLRYLRSTTVGLSRARNVGIAATTAPLVAITDDDCLLNPDWLAGMLAPFDDPTVAVVFCTVLPVPVDEVGHTPHVVIERAQTLRRVEDAWRMGRSGLFLGAGMALRRSAYEELGGFDELLGAGARFGAVEDNDLSWRGLIKGWGTHLTGDVVVMHDGFRDLEQFRGLVRRDLFGVGGVTAKYIRARQFGILRFFGSWMWRFGVTEPFADLRARRRPRGVKRPLFLLHGLVSGLRVPVDRASIRFRPKASTLR